MKKYLFLFFMILISYQLKLLGDHEFIKPYSKSKKIITFTKRIYLQDYPGATNPSFIKFEDGYLMIFRHIPSRFHHWVSHIGIILLDKSFEPISDPQLLDTRRTSQLTPSQSEDARVVEVNGKIYLIYNDNMDVVCPANWERRDMYIAELVFVDNQFRLEEPLKLFYEEKYRSMPWQKNWNPFVWQNQLLLSYTLNPHEVIMPNLDTGVCQKCYETSKLFHWPLGHLRGGAPALLVDGDYLSLFHSGTRISSKSSDNKEMWHYFMGAYTFSADPPFELKKISSTILDTSGFYTYSNYDKRVIYPAGLVQDGTKLHFSYGKDDCELWVGTIDLAELRKSLVEVK
jgi:predicted GH43/DUF377 family glycosyl hydrolase